MTKDVKTLSAEQDIVSVANSFLTSPVRRFPIIDKGVLIGQISRRDILRAAKEIEFTTW